MVSGTVKWFNPRRGYGFLTAEDGTDYFVHYSEIVMDGFRTLKEGAAVRFDVGMDDDGRSVAKHVTAIAA